MGQSLSLAVLDGDDLWVIACDLDTRHWPEFGHAPVDLRHGEGGAVPQRLPKVWRQPHHACHTCMHASPARVGKGNKAQYQADH